MVPTFCVLGLPLRGTIPHPFRNLGPPDNFAPQKNERGILNREQWIFHGRITHAEGRRRVVPVCGVACLRLQVSIRKTFRSGLRNLKVVDCAANALKSVGEENLPSTALESSF